MDEIRMKRQSGSGGVVRENSSISLSDGDRRKLGLEGTLGYA